MMLNLMKKKVMGSRRVINGHKTHGKGLFLMIL